MADSDNAIRLTEGDVLTYTVTIKRAGAAIDLTDHMNTGAGSSVKLYAHDGNAAHGTNQIDGLQAVDNDKASGVVDFRITVSHSTIAGSDTDIRGKWAVELKDAVASPAVTEWTKKEDFFLLRNPFTV